MCADTAVKNNLAMAMAVLIVGGGCLGWVGNKAVDYTFSDVRENTEFRIAKEVEDEHTKQELAELKELIKSEAEKGERERKENKDLLIEIRLEMKGWEPQDSE